MQTLAPALRATVDRHKPGAVLSRKERQRGTMTTEHQPGTPFFAPLPSVQAKSETEVQDEKPAVQAKCDTCHEDEKAAVQAKTEPEKQADIQAKCADCEADDVQRTEDETPAVQQSADPSTASTTRPASDFSGGLTVGKPNDRFEREADQMGEQISRMPLGGLAIGSIGSAGASLRRSLRRQETEETNVQAKPIVQAKSMPTLQRKADGGLQTSGQFTTQVQASTGGGTALSASVQQQMGSAFGADFSNVRIHTDTRAAQLSNDIGAKAFTYRNDIYFNENQYDTGSTKGRFLLAHELTHTVQQGAAVRRAPLPVTTTAPRVQASLFDEALDWMASHFNPDVIPGYSLLSVLIQYDLIRRRRVERTPENLVKGLLELIPIFGVLLFNLLQEHNVIGRAFTWVTNQLTRLNLNQDRIRNTFRQAWDGINIDATDVFDVGAAIDRNLEAIKRPFVALKNDVVTFVEALTDQLMTMLKEALVSVLKGLAIDRLRGYKLFTKVIGHDPITGEDVQAPLEEILADFLDLIGKQQEREEMQKRGTLQRTADWLRTQLARFMGLLGQFRSLVTHLWEAFSFETLRDPMGTLNGLINEGTQLVVNVVDFAIDVATTVLRFIKDALLGLLRTHAHTIRGYKLLTVILGRDPVTDTPVERNAVNLIGGFIELVAGPEKFAEIQQSGAIERMIAWLEAQIERFQITWEGIKQLFTNIWNSLQISDLLNPIGAFIRVVGQFEEPIGRLVGFVVEVVKKVIMTALELMNFPFDLIGQIVDRAMQAYEDIKRDPIAFLKNLLNAVKQGFSQFFGNIGTHLLNGLVGWLTSELQSAGIRPPQDFTFRSVLTFVLDVLGISMEKIWQKLAEHPRIGPQKVARIRGMIDRLTGIWTFVKEVMEEGPGAIWRHIQEQLANLWDMVLNKVKSWIMEQIIDRMVARLLSMLDPTGIMAVINSFIAFYRAVQSFIERLREILEVINSFVGGVAEIARGVVASAANFLERAMASALPTMIGFLANQVGLRGLGSRIGEMIQSVQELVDRGLTWLVNKAVEMGMSLLNSLGLGDKGESNAPNQIEDFSFTDPLSMSGQGHSLTFSFHKNEAELIIASDPTKFHIAVAEAIKEVEKSKRTTKQTDLVQLKKAQKDWNEIKSDIVHNKEQIIKGKNKNIASETDAIRQYAMTRVAQIANDLQTFASTAGIKALDDFYKAPPTERYIPGYPNQTAVGTFIRTKIYEGIHSWDAARSLVTSQERPIVLSKVNNAKNKKDLTEWKKLIDDGLVEKNASINSYDPSIVKYHVDHIEPLAKRWTNQGSNLDDAHRNVELTERSNLRYITEEANTSKSSGGIQYRPYVGPLFVSSIADGGIKGAKNINNQSFLDATGKPIP